MTRINLIPPEELDTRHLVAEYRELPRVFGLIRTRLLKGGMPRIPETYRMGPGHVLFFYNKAPWLARRQASLIEEMLRRGMSPKFTSTEHLLVGIPDATQIPDWEPSPAEILVNRGRIEERLSEMKRC